MSDLTDWELALHGDGLAFARIFDEHRDRVFRHSLRLVDSWADADDAVVVAFLELWRRRHSVRLVDGSVLPWLLVTATNAARNISRSSRRYRALLDRLPAPDRAPDVDERDPSVREAFGRLSRHHQEVLALCVLDGFTEAEAAHVLGIATGTVKSRLSRARRRLRDQLAPLETPSASKEGHDHEHPARAD